VQNANCESAGQFAFRIAELQAVMNQSVEVYGKVTLTATTAISDDAFSKRMKAAGAFSRNAWRHGNCCLDALQARHLGRAHPKEDHMKSENKRVEGAAEVLGGKIRIGVGKLIGDKKMQVTGRARVFDGIAKQELAKAAPTVKGKR